MRFFIDSIREYGVPSHVCGNGGSELKHINFLIDKLNGDNRRNLIWGSSAHNQQIERLWRDVFTKVLDRYYKLYSHMETEGIFDIGNGIHMFALQSI